MLQQVTQAISELKGLNQWVSFFSSKCPADPRTGKAASSTDAATWGTYEEAIARYKSNPAVYQGVGFTFVKEQRYTGIDLDDCIIDGELTPWAQEVIARINSYSELSPSGKGIHIWVRGSLPKSIGPNVELDGNTRTEMYDFGRYFTVTGQHLQGTPLTIEERQEDLTILYNEVIERRARAELAKTKETPPSKLHRVPLAGIDNAYGKAAIEKECDLVASTGNGSRNAQLNASAFSLGTLIGGNVISRNHVERELRVAALQCGLSGSEIEKTMRSGIESGMKEPRTAPTSILKNYDPQYDNHTQNGNGPHKEENAKGTKDLCSFSADDAGNGEAMYKLFGQVFTYNESVGWMYYTGTHWEPDEGSARLTKASIETLRKRRHAAVEAGVESIVKATISDTKRINGAITCFRAHVVVSVNEFDAQEHLLNCKNGAVDLKTGGITPHCEEQRFTYCVPVEYKTTDATEWIDYLQGVVGGGMEMIDYLQLALGYSLTGSTREECLFYVYGPSRSGKGTVSEIFLRLLPRPLSTMVDFNSFTAKREGDVSNFDLAELKPSRVVFASESQRNQSLNPAKIKQLTGGDLVRASFKHKNFFTYRPQFKVWMLSNWPVNGDPEDDALWGRVRVIPFPNSYLGKEDKGKKERLKSDEVLSSILYWGVQGAMKWYSLDSSGLQTPECVRDITKSQRDAQDFVQQWLGECCIADSETWTPNEVVISSYTQWCEGNNVTPKKAKALAQSLQMKGFGTGILKRIGSRVQKGVFGLKIPTTLWSIEEKCNGSESVTDVTQKTGEFAKSIREDDIPFSPVTSVTDQQSVTFYQEDKKNRDIVTETEPNIASSDILAEEVVAISEDAIDYSDIPALVECATKYNGYLCGEHEPATYEDGFDYDAMGNEWCSKCSTHSQLMALGETLGYPAIMRSKKAKDIFVRAGQSAWLACATSWGHDHVGEALKIVQSL